MFLQGFLMAITIMISPTTTDFREEMIPKFDVKCAVEFNMQIEEFKELKETDKLEYIIKYNEVMNSYLFLEDLPETIYDVTSDYEFELLSKIVHAEIKGGTFESKVNVANSIVNRYLSGEYESFEEILTEKNQYSTYASGGYKNEIPDEETILAIEYAFLFEDTTQGATFFKSGDKIGWHDKSKNLEFVFNDGFHKFYKIKEKVVDKQSKW